MGVVAGVVVVAVGVLVAGVVLRGRARPEVLESGVQWPRQKGRTDINFLVALATIKLPFALPMAFHGSWMAARQ